jgi:hypothetical protein
MTQALRTRNGCFMSGKQILLKKVIYCASALISAEALAEGEQRRKFPLRNGDFLIVSKMPKASVLGNLLICSRQ